MFRRFSAYFLGVRFRISGRFWRIISFLLLEEVLSTALEDFGEIFFDNFQGCLSDMFLIYFFRSTFLIQNGMFSNNPMSGLATHRTRRFTELCNCVIFGVLNCTPAPT